MCFYRFLEVIKLAFTRQHHLNTQTNICKKMVEHEKNVLVQSLFEKTKKYVFFWSTTKFVEIENSVADFVKF